MKQVKIKEKKKSAIITSKTRDIVFALSKIKGPFSRKIMTDLNCNLYTESLIKHFFLKKELKNGYWSFSKKKIEARGYKSLNELIKNEGFFRVELLYLFRSKNGKPINLKKRNVSVEDKRISENLFNITYSN